MSSAYNPYGLAPALHPSGIVRPSVAGGPQPLGGLTIASGYANNIFQNSPVQVDSQTPAGNLILVPAQGAASATSIANVNRILGSFQGVEYTLTATGRRTVANFWAAGTVATSIVAQVTRAQDIIYEIQANGSVASTALGAQASITTNGSANGNTTTGFSSVGLDVTTANSLSPPAANAFNQLRIVGFSQRIDNLPGDAFTQVLVQIAAHQDTASQGSY